VFLRIVTFIPKKNNSKHAMQKQISDYIYILCSAGVFFFFFQTYFYIDSVTLEKRVIHAIFMSYFIIFALFIKHD